MPDPRPLPHLELAEAMCITSHHGLTKTAWPCQYHTERAEKVVKELASMRRRALARATEGE